MVVDEMSSSEEETFEKRRCVTGKSSTKVKKEEGYVKDAAADAATCRIAADAADAAAAPSDDVDAPTKRKRKRKRKKKGGNAAAGGDGEGGTTSNNAIDQQAKLGSMDYTVYMEGIPFDSADDDVRHFFANNGIDDILQMRLPKWQDSGRLRGYGHVVFNSIESRSKALKELDRAYMGKRYVTIKEPNAPRPGTTASAMQPNAEGSKPRDQPEGCRVVFVKNLPFGADEDVIHEAFQSCGKILDGGVRVARNYTTRESKGFCYVEFKNPEGAYSAVHRAAKPFGLVVQGRPVFVDYDEGSMKGSFRTGDGKLWNKEHSSAGGGRSGGRGGRGAIGRGGRGAIGRGGRGGGRGRPRW